MCGHVGIISNGIYRQERKVFEDLLYADALRGFDATGIALGYKEFGFGGAVVPHVCKRAMPALDFLGQDIYDAMMHNFGYSSKFIMGHNRWATRGEINNRNSHPFVHGDITLAHNGSLVTQVGLPDHEKFEVDSENIAYSIDKIGVQETVNNLNGSYSLVWFDEGKQTLNFLRNAQRPMIIAKVKGKATYIYASEPGMLGWIAMRNGVAIEESFSTDVNVMYSFDIKSATFEMTKTDVKPVVKSQPKKKHDKPSKTNPYGNDVDGLLREYGLRIGQTVEFSVFETKEHYNNGLLKYGRVDGVMLDEPFLDVMVANVELTDDMKYESTYTGQISSCFFDNQILTVLLRPLTIEAVKDDGKDHDNKEDKGKKEGDEKEVTNIVPFVKKEKVVTLDKVFSDAEEDSQDDASFQEQADAQEEYENTEYVTGPGGRSIPVARFKELTKFGCSNCSCDIVVSDHAIIDWISGSNPICPDCAEDPSCWSGAPTLH